MYFVMGYFVVLSVVAILILYFKKKSKPKYWKKNTDGAWKVRKKK